MGLLMGGPQGLMLILEMALEMSRFLERKDLNKKLAKIDLKPLNLKLEIQQFPGGVSPGPPLNCLFLKRKNVQ